MWKVKGFRKKLKFWNQFQTLDQSQFFFLKEISEFEKLEVWRYATKFPNFFLKKVAEIYFFFLVEYAVVDLLSFHIWQRKAEVNNLSFADDQSLTWTILLQSNFLRLHF